MRKRKKEHDHKKENRRFAIYNTKMARAESFALLEKYIQFSPRFLQKTETNVDVYVNALSWMVEKRGGKLEICVKYPYAKLDLLRFGDIKDIN